MQDSYELLGLSPDADEAQIRSRYLALVKEFPPDRAPEKFAEIRGAYDTLRDPISHLDRRLFTLSSQDSLQALQRDIRVHLQTSKIPMSLLLSLADAP